MGFALRGRWLLLHLVVGAVVSLCVLAGLWQLGRHHERQDRNAVLAERRAMPEVPLERAGDDVDGAVHRHVVATGTFDATEQLMLRGRALRGQPGDHVLTPLVLAGGEAVLVDRGWVPIGMDTPPVPSGRVSVRGVLVPSEGGAFEGDGSRVEALTRLHVQRVAAQVPYTLHPAYLLLQQQEPPPGDFPEPVPLPEPDAGSHLSYAVQWFLFATVGVVGYGALLRRESRRPPAPVEA